MDLKRGAYIVNDIDSLKTSTNYFQVQESYFQQGNNQTLATMTTEIDCDKDNINQIS